jgi:hypothetical protein
MNRGDTVLRTTIGGAPSRGMVYAKLTDHLREAADCMAVMSHLHQTEGNATDTLLAKGWLGMHELILRLITQVTKLAANKLQ